MEITKKLASGVLEINFVDFFMMREKFAHETVFCVELGDFRLFGKDFHFFLVGKFIVVLIFFIVEVLIKRSLQ